MSSPYFSTTVRNFLVVFVCFFITAAAISGYKFLLSHRACPQGLTLTGIFDRACIKITSGDEVKTRVLYYVAEIQSNRYDSVDAKIVFDAPMPVNTILEMLSHGYFTCTKGYFFDPNSRLYQYRAFESVNCEILRSEIVPDEGEYAVNAAPVALSIGVRASSHDLFELWKNSATKVRAVAIRSVDDSELLNFNHYPEVE